MMMMSKMMTTSPAMIKTRTLTTGLTTLERTRGASSHLGILTVVADSHTHTHTFSDMPCSESLHGVERSVPH